MAESLSRASLRIISVPGHTLVFENGAPSVWSFLHKKYLILQISKYQTNLFCDQKCKCDSVSGWLYPETHYQERENVIITGLQPKDVSEEGPGRKVMSSDTNHFPLGAEGVQADVMALQNNTLSDVGAFLSQDSLENPSYYHERGPRREAQPKEQTSANTTHISFGVLQQDTRHLPPFQQTIVPSSLHFHHWVACFFLTCSLKQREGKWPKKQALCPKELKQVLELRQPKTGSFSWGKVSQISQGHSFIHSHSEHYVQALFPSGIPGVNQLCESQSTL